MGKCVYPKRKAATAMVIRNTSSYPDQEVRELVEAATDEIDMRHVCVNVKGGRTWGGYAYDCVPDISNAPPSSKYLVTIKLPPTFEQEDFNVHRSERWPKFRAKGWQELLVVIAAHEAKHIEQYREHLKRSEVRCEWFARYMLSRYRGRRQAAKDALALSS